MKTFGWLLGAVCALSALGCEKSQTPSQTAEDSPQAVKTYGEPVAQGTGVSIAKVVEATDQYADKPAQLFEGTVRKVCQKKGCWMELAASKSAEEPGARVTFKDYGFFVPMDSAGSHARIAGTLQVTRVEAKDVAHLEAEGGKFPLKNPDGSAKELRIVATGVELHNKSGSEEGA